MTIVSSQYLSIEILSLKATMHRIQNENKRAKIKRQKKKDRK